MTEKEFLEGLTKLNIKYDENVYSDFNLYTENLLSYNEKVNLTRITDKREIFIKHYLDSVSVLKYFNIKEKAKVIDIGTGAGFPAIPIKIVRKDLDVYLVDSLKKRVVFLEDIVKKLNLKNVHSIHSRAEDLAFNPDFREKFDIVVSRAVANLSVLLEYDIPFLKNGGYLLALKGQNVDEEISKSENALKELGGKIIEKIDVEIPFSDLNHKILIIKKIKPTKKKYPRKPALIKKQPL